VRHDDRGVFCWVTLRNDDQEPLFCGATPAPSCSFDADDVMVGESDSCRIKLCSR